MMKSLELQTTSPLRGISTIGADKLQTRIVKINLKLVPEFL